jgi:hypothetical protein
MALGLPTWMPMLALTGQAHRWEPRRLRLRLFSTAAHVITDALQRLTALPSPG